MTKEEKEDKVIEAAAQMDVMASKLTKMADELRANPSHSATAYRAAYMFRTEYGKRVIRLLGFGNPNLRGH
jgi:hypothetical protein